MTDELKPVKCGCGGEAEIYHNFGGLSFVHCKGCDIVTAGHNTESAAIEAWNRAMGAKDINVPNKEKVIIEPFTTDWSGNDSNV